jgi:hypothetical protein
MKPLARGVLAGCLLAWHLAVPAAAAASGPELIVRAPVELAGAAAELRGLGPDALAPAMQLTGLADPGPPIVVVLATESSAQARRAPAWISGYAEGDASVVVLFPARVARYPDRALVPLLRHEVTHVLAARAAAGRPLPRWFDEGLAMAAGRELDAGDRARVALAVLTDARLPLARIDAAFRGGTSDVTAAYALARDVVRELLEAHGEGAGAAILARIAAGERFPAAFLAVTGVTLDDFETAYWKRRTFWDRWLPIVTSSVLLWGGIALLAVAAFRRRAVRDAATRARWDEEEGGRVRRDLDEPPPP